MSDVVQVESNEPVTAGGPQGQDAVWVPGYHVVPYGKGADQEDLFAYRTAMAELEQAEEAKPKEANAKRTPALLLILLILALLAVAAMLVLAVPKVMSSSPALFKVVKPNAPVLYIDMGSRRFDPAGLGGRLIARWEGSAAYELYIDPLDPQQAEGFQAVAENPPYPLSFVVRLHDPSGVVQCQKEIAIPAPAPQADPPDPAQALQPRQTPSGDTVQNIAGPDGNIAEITVSGGLPCSQTAYQHLAAWDFTTNFPVIGGQENWLRQENDLAAGRKRHSAGAQGFIPRVQPLPTAIDGDDVIVGDNPVRGTVDTGGGRVFLVGAIGMRNRSAEWQIFPASIHFHCDKNGTCVLTRTNSHTTLQARLMK